MAITKATQDQFAQIVRLALRQIHSRYQGALSAPDYTDIVDMSRKVAPLLAWDNEGDMYRCTELVIRETIEHFYPRDIRHGK